MSLLSACSTCKVVGPVLDGISTADLNGQAFCDACDTKESE